MQNRKMLHDFTVKAGLVTGSHFDGVIINPGDKTVINAYFQMLLATNMQVECLDELSTYYEEMMFGIYNIKNQLKTSEITKILLNYQKNVDLLELDIPVAIVNLLTDAFIHQQSKLLAVGFCHAAEDTVDINAPEAETNLVDEILADIMKSAPESKELGFPRNKRHVVKPFLNMSVSLDELCRSVDVELDYEGAKVTFSTHENDPTLVNVYAENDLSSKHYQCDAIITSDGGNALLNVILNLLVWSDKAQKKCCSQDMIEEQKAKNLSNGNYFNKLDHLVTVQENIKKLDDEVENPNQVDVQSYLASPKGVNVPIANYTSSEK